MENKKIISEIQIVPIKPRDGLVAFASFVLYESFYMGSLGIMTRPTGGYRISYPTKKLLKGPMNIYHPINKEISLLVEKLIIEKYEAVVEGSSKIEFEEIEFK